MILKLTLAPLLVALASLVAQRFGPGRAGLLTGFPIVGGPIFLFLVIERGEGFGVKAAAGALAGLAAWAMFFVCYLRVCRMHGWLRSMLSATVVFLATALLLSGWQPELAASIAVGTAVPLLTSTLMPARGCSGIGPRLPRVELLIRMAAAGALVLAITELAAFSGPTLAGLLTSFPIVTGVLAMFSQRLYGPNAAIDVLRGSASGLYGYVAFFAVAALTLAHGILVSGTSALVAALTTQAVAYRLQTRSVR
jgi:hypothetical protein